MNVPLTQLKSGQANQTLKYDTYEPYLHIDNPTNCRIVFSDGSVVGPYTLNAVIATPSSTGSFQVDTSDTTYPNVNIFSTAQINAYLTDSESPNPGINYAPTTFINAGSVTISGNVGITGTPNVNIQSQTANLNVQFPAPQQVTINSGTVNATISGNVGITGTPNVNIQSQTANLNVQFPAPQQVTINSGTVNATISGTPNINIQSQSVNVSTQQPPTALTNLAFPLGTSTQTTGTVPTGTHSLRFACITAGRTVSNFTIKGHQSGSQYYPSFPTGNLQFGLASGSAPLVIPIDSSTDSTYDVTGTWSGAATLSVVAILDTSAVFATNATANPLVVVFPEQPILWPGGWDSYGESKPAAGTAASVVFAAIPGHAFMLDFMKLGILTGANGYAGNTAVILDGATEIGAEYFNVAANSSDRPPPLGPGMKIKGTVGNSMTVKFSATAAGISELVMAGAYVL